MFAANSQGLQRCFVPAALVVLALAPLGVFGQAEQLGVKKLEDDFKQFTNERRKMLRGEKQPTTKEDKAIIDNMAKAYFYRLTFVTYRDYPKKMEMAYNEFDYEMGIALYSQKTNRELINQFMPLAVASLKEVFAQDFMLQRHAQVNAAMMLPTLAKFKHEALGDYLVQLASDKGKHDAIKFYAMRGLREFFPLKALDDVNFDPKDKLHIKKKERDLERIQVLLDSIGRQWPTPATSEEREAIRYVRREAVTSLAQAGVPALAALKKKGDAQAKVEGPVAYGLVRVLLPGKDGLDPEPSLSEKCEAALGLCRMKNNAIPDYDPNVGVVLVGQCLVDFTREYRKDLIRITGKDKKPAVMPWKTYAERFKQGLKDLVGNTKETAPANANALRLEQSCSGFWPSIQAYKDLDNYNLFNPLTVESMKAPSGVLYQNSKGPEIDPASLKPAPPKVE